MQRTVLSGERKSATSTRRGTLCTWRESWAAVVLVLLVTTLAKTPRGAPAFSSGLTHGGDSVTPPANPHRKPPQL